MFSISVAGGLAGAVEGAGGGPPSPEVSPDFGSFWESVVLYSRLDASPPIDLSISGHTLTDGGAGAVLDNTNFRFGLGSWDFDNTSTAYVEASDNADFNLGANDFTIECWVRFDADPGATDDSYFVSQWDETSDQRGWALALRNDTISWRYSTNGQSGTVVELSASWTPVDAQFYHVVVFRSAGITRILIDGEILAVGADAATYHDSTAALRIGTPVDTADGNFQRNVDEVRITNGVGRYG